ncbi:hypothetical protein OIU79_023899 [Salix purpurea]|uniref:Uncharacterized protein n=1 Tax=Salix purpurea TaxID=77065 RepID=A0A9Q1A9V5_SALPP|nr:hypothetical protein OIU79_023899 [Salix purpurea]
MDTPLSKDPIKVEVSYEWKPSLAMNASSRLWDPSSEPREFVAHSTTTTYNDGKHAKTKHVHPRRQLPPPCPKKAVEEEEGGKEALRRPWASNGLIEPRFRGKFYLVEDYGNGSSRLELC